MYLICYGTRPEYIKLAPLINIFSEKRMVFKTLFSGQHATLLDVVAANPDIVLSDIMEHGQSLNALVSKILTQMDRVFETETFTSVIVQGDTSTSFAIAFAAFQRKINIIHVEAGLRTGNKYSPFPEEVNRLMISRIADVHFCPTARSVNNLLIENIHESVFNVGNTVVDAYHQIIKTTTPNENLKNILELPFILVTLHRRENRGNKMESIWQQLNQLSSLYSFVYITHPSIPNAKDTLSSKISCIPPQDYIDMVHLISKCQGIITDSGGIQEEATCAGKRVLVCRDTTERPETIECGLGLLVDTRVIENIDFLNKPVLDIMNPFGNDVCNKIAEILLKLNI